MVLKPTNIHSNFFPSRTRGGAAQYQTEDVAAPESGHNGLNAGGSPSGTDATQMQTAGFAPQAARGQGNEKSSASLEKKLSNDNIILVDWDGPDDPENPMNWPTSKKWTNAMTLCLMCLTIGLSTGFGPCLGQIAEEFNTSVEIGQVALLVFNGAFAFVPLFLGPLSEFVGSRPVYLISMFFFCVWFIGLALSQNIGSILVFRFLSGCSGAAGVTIVPGTLSNVFPTRERTIPVALFSLVAVFGTVGGPLIWTYVAETKGWRWVLWVQLIVNSALFIALFAFLRENRGSVLLTRRAKKLRKETGDNRYRSAAEIESPSIKALLHASTTRAALLLVREPVVLAFSLWLAFCWSLIFASFALLPIISEGFGWPQINYGLAYIGGCIGCFIAFGLSFVYKRLYDQAQAKNGGVAVPEARLYGGAVGGILCTIGLFIVSFTSYNYLHWIGPQIGLCIVLIGIYGVFESVQAYLSDAYLEYAASAIGAQGFVRNLMAASFPLFSTQLFTNLHVWGGGLLLSCLLLVAIPLPFILIKYGETIRSRSPYAAASTGLTQKTTTDEEKGNLQGPVQGARRSRKDLNASRANSISDETNTASGPQTRVATPEPVEQGKKEEDVKVSQA
ncbi:unnamed protein product [Sympodiomycopsis kandeliae]